MSAPIPQIEPTEFTAGETVSWTKSLGDYSYADGWRLTYYLRGPATLDLATTADTDGKGFAATITATVSTAFPAGDYWLQGVVSDGTTTKALPQTKVAVAANPAQLQAGYDGRTHARKMLDALRNAQLQTTSGGATNRIVKYTIEGERSVELMTQEQWKNEYAFWEGRVNWEEKQAAIDRGERVGVFMRFKNPV